jgi:hypothetical protein
LKSTVLFIFIAFLFSCSQIPKKDVDDPVLARVADDYLYASEVIPNIPKNISSRDSLVMVRNYVNNWLQQQVLLNKAEESLTADELNFNKQLREYKNSLTLYAFESKLIKLYLDTNVTDHEIRKYYEENKERFELQANIVKFDYVKLPLKSHKLKDFKKLMQSDDPADFPVLEDYCEKYSTDYWLPRDWVFFEDLAKEVPIKVDNEENFLRRTSYTQIKDSLYWHLLKITDYKTTDSIPPLTFEEDNIRDIIINARKLQLIQEKRQEYINSAVKEKIAETY